MALSYRKSQFVLCKEKKIYDLILFAFVFTFLFDEFFFYT